MKIVFSIVVFLYSLSTAAQLVMPDGSYYNDDIIRDGSIMPPVPPQAPPSQGIAVGEPDPNQPPFPRRQMPKPKYKPKRGGFREVQSGGSVSGFRDVTGGGVEHSDRGRGSK